MVFFNKTEWTYRSGDYFNYPLIGQTEVMILRRIIKKEQTNEQTTNKGRL